MSIYFNDGLTKTNNGLEEISKDQENNIDSIYNFRRNAINNTVPIINSLFLLCFYNDIYRVLEDIVNVGETFEEDPLNIQHSAAFSQFLLFFLNYLFWQQQHSGFGI